MSQYLLLKRLTPSEQDFMNHIIDRQTDHNHGEQLLTHHDRNKSVAVSAVVNNANTIQYIIHFT